MRVLLLTVLLVAVCTAQAQDVDLTAPPKEQDREVVAALDWLARHQDTEGTWSASKFDARCVGTKCGGLVAEDNVVGTTSLAMLAFLGRGETNDSGSHRGTVRKAAKALIGLQDETGFVGSKTGVNARLAHAYAAFALAEMYGITGARSMKEPARRAVGSIVSLQDASGGWKVSDSDAACSELLTSVCVLTLRSAELSAIEVDDASFARVVRWLDGAPAKSEPVADARTAASLVARIFAKWDFAALAKDERYAKDAALFASRPPEWKEKLSDGELLTWCVAAPALFQKGGEPWSKWWTAFQKAAVARQCADPARCDRGSWALGDPAIPFGGRVATTALVCRALEATYLYGRLAEKK